MGRFDMDTPFMLAFLDGETFAGLHTWWTWCCYCRNWHRHGGGALSEEPMEELGHPKSHCYSPDSDGSSLLGNSQLQSVVRRAVESPSEEGCDTASWRRAMCWYVYTSLWDN